MGDVERGNVDMMHRLQNQFCGSTQIKPHLSRKTENLKSFGFDCNVGTKRVGIPPSHPPISPYSRNPGGGSLHSRSLSQPLFFLNDSLPPLSPSLDQKPTSPPSGNSLQITEGLPPRKAHRRSISDVPFGLQSIKRELSSDMNIEGEVVDDLMSAYMNMDSIDALNSSGTDENRVSDNEAESSVIEAGSITRHYRSVSMDSFMGSLSFGDESTMLPSSSSRSTGVGQLFLKETVEGNANGFNLDFGHGQFSVTEMQKIMANEKLAEIALSDPKRVKRILANRQSAARSKERKTRYISELEQKVQTLQSEATALSAKLTLIQRDSSRLTDQNNELKFRLQAIERQAQLQEALSEALTAEVQRLKMETGDLNHETMSKCFGQQLHINPQTFQHQQKQQQSSHTNDNQEHQKANDPNNVSAMTNESTQLNP